MKRKIGKKTVIILVGVVAFVVLVTILNALLKPKPKIQKVSEYVNMNVSHSSSDFPASSSKVDTTNQSEVDEKLGIISTSSSSSLTSASLSHSDLVKSVMQDYCSITLDNSKLEQRAKDLSGQLSAELYKSLAIDSDTNKIKSMLENWNKRKVLDTNQPVQLVEQTIVSLQVYNNASDDTDFLVVATEQIKSPASENQSTTIRTYSVQTFNGTVSAIKEVNEVAG